MAKPRDDAQLALFGSPEPAAPPSSPGESEPEQASEAEILEAALERRQHAPPPAPAAPSSSSTYELPRPAWISAPPAELSPKTVEAPSPPPPRAPAPRAVRDTPDPRERPTAREAPAPEPRPVLTVAELDRLAQRVLERASTGLLVRGEVSGLSRSGAGHLYFTLKDERLDACIECMMYRTAPARARRQLTEGERVVVAGRLTVYAARGRMQLVVEDVLQTARGALLEKLERLKAALAAEGIFDAARKKPLPKDARFIAVLTSRGGAAIHDFVRVAHRRGAARIVLVDTPVQGAAAAERIAAAIARADRLGADVLVVTRGGGSAEDLAAYNEEVVVRAIASAATPVVSAVGHEIDTSLADLAADARAATPSQAAELLVPDDEARRASLDHLRERLVRGLGRRIERRASAIAHLRARLGDPRRLLLEQAQRLDDLRSQLERSQERRLRGERSRLESTRRRLDQQHPRRVLGAAHEALAPQLPALERAMRRELERQRARLPDQARLTRLAERRLTTARRKLEGSAARLDALSPLAVLARGYAIVTRDDHVVAAAREVDLGDRIEIRLGSGRLGARVEARHDLEEDDAETGR